MSNSLTWKTTFYSLRKNVRKTWYFEEELIKKIIKGINRKFNYYVSDIIIHVFPKTSNQKVTKVHIKYLIWTEDKKSLKNIYYISSQIILAILTYLFSNYQFKLEIKSIHRNMIIRNTEMLGDYLSDKIMLEPHRDKQIINREFKLATNQIKK